MPTNLTIFVEPRIANTVGRADLDVDSGIIHSEESSVVLDAQTTEEIHEIALQDKAKDLVQQCSMVRHLLRLSFLSTNSTVQTSQTMAEFHTNILKLSSQATSETVAAIERALEGFKNLALSVKIDARRLTGKRTALLPLSVDLQTRGRPKKATPIRLRTVGYSHLAFFFVDAVVSFLLLLHNAPFQKAQLRKMKKDSSVDKENIPIS